MLVCLGLICLCLAASIPPLVAAIVAAIGGRTIELKGPRPMAKLTDLRDAADSALANQLATTTAKASADHDVSVSVPRFAAAIKLKGGKVNDNTVTPAVLYTSEDGLSFEKSALPSITDDAPEVPADHAPAGPSGPGFDHPKA